MLLTKTDLSCSFPSIPPDFPSITGSCPSGPASPSLDIVSSYGSPLRNFSGLWQQQKTQRAQHPYPSGRT